MGRFPANLLVSDNVLDDGKITKSTGGSGIKRYRKLEYMERNVWTITRVARLFKILKV